MPGWLSRFAVRPGKTAALETLPVGVVGPYGQRSSVTTLEIAVALAGD